MWEAVGITVADRNGNPVIFSDTDKDDKTITINADVFGTYMIVYWELLINGFTLWLRMSLVDYWSRNKQ